MTIDIDAKAKALVDAILAEPATDHDIDVVQRQLGRYPRGMVAGCPMRMRASARRHHPARAARRHTIPHHLLPDGA